MITSHVIVRGIQPKRKRKKNKQISFYLFADDLYANESWHKTH